MEFLSLLEPQMKHLSFSIFLEIFLLNWVEIKLNPTTHFRACIGACLDLYWGLGISVLVGRLLILMIKTLILFPLSESWKFPRMWQKQALSLSFLFLLLSPIPITAEHTVVAVNVNNHLVVLWRTSWVQCSFFKSFNSWKCHWMFSSQTHSVPSHCNLSVSCSCRIDYRWDGATCTSGGWN